MHVVRRSILLILPSKSVEVDSAGPELVFIGGVLFVVDAAQLRPLSVVLKGSLPVVDACHQLSPQIEVQTLSACFCSAMASLFALRTNRLTYWDLLVISA